MGIFGPPNLEKLKEENNIGGLIKALSHKDKNIRTKAANILGHIRDSSAIEALKNLLQDHEETVRAAAQQAVTNIEEGKKRAEEEHRKKLEEQIVRKLSGVSEDEKISNAIELLKTQDLETRIVTASLLAKLGIEAVGVWYELANTLGDEHEEMRFSAAKAFWELEGVDYAIRSLRDEYNSPEHMKKKDAIKGIYALKKTSDNALTFYGLIKTNWEECPTHEMELQRLIDADGIGEANRIVFELVESPNPWVRVRISPIAIKLGCTDDNSRAWIAIAKLLADEIEEVRQAAAVSFWLREKEFVPTVKKPFSPVVLAISSLQSHFKTGGLNRTQVARAIINLVDTTPRDPFVESVRPLVVKYLNQGSWSEILGWEEIKSEMLKRGHFILF
jgi:HEAT repeat protein